jgi:hypothetical protein
LLAAVHRPQENPGTGDVAEGARDNGSAARSKSMEALARRRVVVIASSTRDFALPQPDTPTPISPAPNHPKIRMKGLNAARHRNARRHVNAGAASLQPTSGPDVNRAPGQPDLLMRAAPDCVLAGFAYECQDGDHRRD